MCSSAYDHTCNEDTGTVRARFRASPRVCMLPRRHTRMCLGPALRASHVRSLLLWPWRYGKGNIGIVRCFTVGGNGGGRCNRDRARVHIGSPVGCQTTCPLARWACGEGGRLAPKRGTGSCGLLFKGHSLTFSDSMRNIHVPYVCSRVRPSGGRRMRVPGRCAPVSYCTVSSFPRIRRSTVTVARGGTLIEGMAGNRA